MDWTEAKIKQQLAGRRVLIVEDDIDLACGLKQLLQAYGVEDKDIVVRRCVKGDDQGGLNALHRAGWEFDLILVDTMLPWDETALKACDKLQKEWDDLQVQIAPMRGQSGFDAELTALRAKLTFVSSQLRATIDREAGAKMINQWLAEPLKLATGRSAKRPAVLFLTARQEAPLRPLVSKCKVRSRWLTKPALEAQILRAAAELLSESDVHQETA